VEFLSLDEDARRAALLASGLTAEAVADVLQAARVLPELKVHARLFVEDEGETAAGGGFFDDDKPASASEAAAPHPSEVAVIPAEAGAGSAELEVAEKVFEGDLVTLRVKLTRLNVTAGAAAGPAHAPRFPKTVYESWWVILTDRVAAQGKKAAAPAVTETNIHAVEKLSETGREVSECVYVC
jgi:hypothetical protein